jgi:hypothetical protein
MNFTNAQREFLQAKARDYRTTGVLPASERLEYANMGLVDEFHRIDSRASNAAANATDRELNDNDINNLSSNEGGSK